MLGLATLPGECQLRQQRNGYKQDQYSFINLKKLQLYCTVVKIYRENLQEIVSADLLDVLDVDDGGCYGNRGKRDDIDEEDDQESYFRYMEENPTAGLINDDDDNIEYDEDGNAIIPEKKVTVACV